MSNWSLRVSAGQGTGRLSLSSSLPIEVGRRYILFGVSILATLFNKALRSEMNDPLPAAGQSLDAAAVRRIVDRSIDRYVAARHARVDAFVEANFGLSGSLRLHRQALGLDLVRAPANVALIPPYLALQIGSAGARRLGAEATARWLETRKLFLDTDVARELTWRLHVDLLELPYVGARRRTDRDALAEEILRDPRLGAVLNAFQAAILHHREDEDLRRRVNAMLGTYSDARTAAAELVVSTIMAGAGAAVFKQLTPGVLSLGPAIAGAIAQKAAIASFPLGAGAGSVWYGYFAAAPSAGLVAGTTGGLMLLAAAATAFAGVVGDPVQRALGLHQRRLHKLIDALGNEMRGGTRQTYRVRDHYAARIFDLLDVIQAVQRLAG